MLDDVVNVEVVQHGISVLPVVRQPSVVFLAEAAHLGQACCKYYNFIDLPHALHEGVDAWPFDNIHVVYLVFNLDGNDKVGRMYEFER